MTRPTTLITGASSGIGRAFAEQSAADGSDLVLVARRRERLEELAGAIRARHGVEVEVIPADLSEPNAGTRLVEAVTERNRTIDALINNAGLGAHGDLAGGDPAGAMTQIAVNIAALTELTALLLPGMVERGAGDIINVASTAAYQPVPHMAVYAASKAYVLSFTRALWAETRGTGVRVLAICPGATDTEFFDIAGEDASVGPRRTPEQVVATAARALRRNRPSVVDGRQNALVATVAPRLPERVSIGLAERSVRPAPLRAQPAHTTTSH